MEPNQTPAPAAGGSTGGLISVLIGIAILLVAAVVAFLIFGTKAAPALAPAAPVEQAAVTTESIPAPPEDATATAIATQGTSDDVADIEKDLNATDLKTLDGVNQI